MGLRIIQKLPNLIESWWSKPGSWLDVVRLFSKEFANSEEAYPKFLLETYYPGFQETGEEQITVPPEGDEGLYEI